MKDKVNTNIKVNLESTGTWKIRTRKFGEEK